MAKVPPLKASCSPALDDITEHVKAAMDAIPDPKMVADLTQQLMIQTSRKTVAPSDVMVSGIINSLLSGTGTAVANSTGIVFKAVTEPLIELVRRTFTAEEAGRRVGEDGVEEVIKTRGLGTALNEMVAGYGAMLNSFKLATSMAKEGWSKAYPLDFNAALVDLARTNAMDVKEFRELLAKELIDYRASLMAQSKNISIEDARQAIKDSGYLDLSTQDGKAEFKEEAQAFLNEAYDYQKNAFTGKLAKFGWVNIPTKATVAIDEFGKSLFRQYRIGQMAARKAQGDILLNGGKGNLGELTNAYIKMANKGIVEGDATTTLRNLQRNVGETFGKGRDDFVPYNTIKDYAQRQMFQQRLTGAPASVHRMLQENPPLRLFVPFMKTPWNITKEGFSYLPGPSLLMKNGYPLAARAIAKFQGKEYKESVKRLGAYYELSNSELVARNAVGAAYFAGIYTLMQEDNITGKPRDYQEAARWKDQNIKEQSIKVGDKWYDYSRIEPVATVFGLFEELHRAYQDYINPPSGAEPSDEALKGVMYALKANVMQKSFVDGFNQLINGLMEPDKTLETIALAATKPLTPALMAQAARILDPHERQASTWTEKLQQRVPVLREDLPQDYGLYGGERTSGSGSIPVPFTDGVTTNLKELTSFGVSSAEQTPLQKAFTDSGITAIRNNKKFRGVGLNNEQLAEYRRRINEAITRHLSPLANQQGFQNLPAGQKRKVLERSLRRIKKPVVAQYAEDLKRQYPEVARKLREVELYNLGIDDEEAQ